MRAHVVASLLSFIALTGACSGDAKHGADAGPGASGQGAAVAGNGGSAGQAGASGNAGIDDATSPNLDAGADSSSPPAAAGAFAVPGLAHDITPGAPLTTPEREWSYVPFDDAFCANGSTTGIAVNRVADAAGVLIFLQGGGACWDANSCLVTNSSVHLHEDVGESIVLPEAQRLSGLFDRSNAASPFRDYGYVYSSYCTGDLHAGTTVTTYQGSSGPVDIHHYGARNVDAYLARLVATFPHARRVIVMGVSAGGFGATFNWWRIQGAFPAARVDVLDDAGLVVDPSDDRFTTMVANWKMALPPGCTDCGKRMSAWLPFYAEHLIAPRRYGLTAFLGDPVIGQYFALDAATLKSELLQLRTAAGANQKTFFLEGAKHSVIGESAGMTTSDGANAAVWILQLATDDPKWDHAGP